MAFLNSNVASGVPKNSQFQVGTSNVNPSRLGEVEDGLLLAWPQDNSASWIYYDCTVGVMADSGIVVHNRLPQIDRRADTLGSCDYNDPKLEERTGGVNLQCLDQYTDIVQRMGHTRYWFRLWGQALRIGQQVPIPSLKTIGGVPAIPYDANPQWAYNRIAPSVNYGGIILWHAVWSLWYTTAVPPRNNYIPVADPAAHLNVNAKIPTDGIQAPYSQPDDNTAVGGNNANFGGGVGGNFGIR